MKRSGEARRSGRVSLERALSKLGIASRTVSREWIRSGRVAVNGVIQRHPEFPVQPEKARIEIDGEKITLAVPRSILLHKPRGVVTTRSDEKGRPTVFSLLGEEDKASHLIAVGRLDWATSGLLLLTNDTHLANWLTDPANQVGRTYLVSVRGRVSEEKMQLLGRGIEDQGEFLKPDSLVLRKASGRESHLVITLCEGKNREVRRLLAAIGHEVTRLKRVAYGALELGELGPGEFRELGTDELRALFPDAPIRRSGDESRG